MQAQQVETRLDGPVLIELKAFGDHRGFFMETFRQSALTGMGIDHDWVQDNHSRSTRGVVRGMHFAIGEGQAKLVRCANGSIVDVVVDLRRGSPTYAEWEAFELSDENRRMIYCPIGFAHGFCVTSAVADVVYKCSSYYDGAVERAIAHDDPDVGIEWPRLDLSVSDRDAAAPRLRDVERDLPFTHPGG
jgi:dTDP-4-dehydrorhamnose 3,5-epimerase